MLDRIEFNLLFLRIVLVTQKVDDCATMTDLLVPSTGLSGFVCPVHAVGTSNIADILSYSGR